MRAIGIWAITITLVCTFLGISVRPMYAKTPEDYKAPTTIWYIPHPDDETLGMAGAIIRSIRAGNKNIFVFLTRGGNTLIRLVGAPGGDLRTSEVKAARMREAKEAIKALGGNPANIVFYDFPDGNLTLEQALKVIREYNVKYPGAMHRTVSIQDTHPDHRVLAKALATVSSESTTHMDVAYYRVYIFREPPEKRLTQTVLAVRISESDRKLKQQAIAAYRTYDPTLGHYAIGGRSVPSLFTQAAADPYEYREALPSLFRATMTAHVQVEDLKLIQVGSQITFPASAWRVEVEGTPGHQPNIQAQIDYRICGLPALGRLYIGGRIKFEGADNTPYLLIGATSMDILYAEYRQPIGVGSLNGSLHWGVRWTIH